MHTPHWKTREKRVKLEDVFVWITLRQISPYTFESPTIFFNCKIIPQMIITHFFIGMWSTQVFLFVFPNVVKGVKVTLKQICQSPAKSELLYVTVASVWYAAKGNQIWETPFTGCSFIHSLSRLTQISFCENVACWQLLSLGPNQTLTCREKIGQYIWKCTDCHPAWQQSCQRRTGVRNPDKASAEESKMTICPSWFFKMQSHGSSTSVQRRLSPRVYLLERVYFWLEKHGSRAKKINKSTLSKCAITHRYSPAEDHHMLRWRIMITVNMKAPQPCN